MTHKNYVKFTFQCVRNKILLERRCAHLFTCCLWLFLCYSIRVELLQQTLWLQHQQYLLPGSLLRKFASPCPTPFRPSFSQWLFQRRHIYIYWLPVSILDTNTYCFLWTWHSSCIWCYCSEYRQVSHPGGVYILIKGGGGGERQIKYVECPMEIYAKNNNKMKKRWHGAGGGSFK